MADNAFQFVVDRLLPEHIYCYMVSLLKVGCRFEAPTGGLYRGSCDFGRPPRCAFPVDLQSGFMQFC